ncbi:E3 SUMO-protein ligase ZBED1-like [Ictalurus furcatus]|uniref:E3 SUMO-protein ligase ZBED1-like n=1 Tax=Ictalurus furcatus TaxID=66913 RepID=UPI002350821E|nr:E3 SUMO-protein ligase ZBED1-like [Ictalurus furcatus]
MSTPDRNTNATERASTSEEKADEVVDKRGKTNSVVWKWFGYLSSDKLQVSVRCKMCRRAVPTSSGNTSNLFHHLKQFHPIEYSESQKMRHHKGLSQPVSEISPRPTSPSPAVSKEKPMQQTWIAAFMPQDKQSKRYKDITKAVTNFLAKDMMPFSMVENVGFRKMMSVIDPRYEIPGRKYFSSTAIPTLYSEVRERVQEQLKSGSYFATTADLWSSRTSEPYLSLTVHFIDQDWKLVSLCLQTVYFPEDHTGEAIAAGLTDALASWGLSEERQVCITTDSGTNIIKAVELNRWRRLQCFGHRLNSAIGKLYTVNIHLSIMLSYFAYGMRIYYYNHCSNK